MKIPDWSTYPRGTCTIINDYLDEVNRDLIRAVNKKILQSAPAAELFVWTLAEIMIQGFQDSNTSSPMIPTVRKPKAEFVRIPSSLSRDIKFQENRLRKIQSKKKRLRQGKINRKLSEQDEENLANTGNF